jgi:predicted DNA-binding transcriptional regulator AlpA
MAPDGLIGFKELPPLLGVGRSTAARYTKRADFPAPVDRLASGPVWRREDVERWGGEHKPPLKGGRPPKSPTD